jgi:hypothetical protein
MSDKEVMNTKKELAHSANVGSIAIEQERAIAEAQGQLTLAKRFPRNMITAYNELMESCSSKAFATSAFYSVPNRGSGPSIRFAEEVARVYGNFVYGHRELSRSEGKSEVEVFAWDMEKNNRSTRQITIMHVQDRKEGARILKDQSDIDSRIANVSSKQMRGRILALLPKSLIADAIEKCKATIAGTSKDPISIRVRKMADSFKSTFGVTNEMIEKYIGTSIENTSLDQLVDLVGVFNALKEGSKASEYFPSGKIQSPDAMELDKKIAEASNAVPEKIEPKIEEIQSESVPDPKVTVENDDEFF